METIDRKIKSQDELERECLTRGHQWAAARIAELEAENEQLSRFIRKHISADPDMYTELEAKHTALEDGLRPIATEMIEPECPEDEVDDCETCQCFIDWGNRILALLGKEKDDE